METIFVTGATGFIGNKLVQELVCRGHRVRVFTRRTSETSDLHHDRVVLVTGDVRDVDSLQEGMRGCRQVYHMAAYAKIWSRDPQTFFQHNVQGFQNVIEAARLCDVERVVYTSTVVTLGPTPHGLIASEESGRVMDRYFTEYEHSKVLAERLAMRYAAEGFPLVIVNPTRVYGPGKLTEGNSVTQMIDLYDRGRMPLILNGGVNVGNYVFVDDLVKGHILAMENGRMGERYLLGGENVSLQRLFEYVDEVSGKKHIQINLPPLLAQFYARLELRKAEWFGMYPRITPGWVETFLHDWAYSCSKAEQELGYAITPLKEGIRQTYEWIVSQRSNSQEHRGKMGNNSGEQVEANGADHFQQKRPSETLTVREAMEDSEWANLWPVMFKP